MLLDSIVGSTPALGQPEAQYRSFGRRGPGGQSANSTLCSQLDMSASTSLTSSELAGPLLIDSVALVRTGIRLRLRPPGPQHFGLQPLPQTNDICGLVSPGPVPPSHPALAISIPLTATRVAQIPYALETRHTPGPRPRHAQSQEGGAQ
jgi:hypothetical protein